jgi:hypothetical protein
VSEWCDVMCLSLNFPRADRVVVSLELHALCTISSPHVTHNS